MMTPPMTPAATPQPKQRASAVVGTAVAARATAAAAARAVSVLVICPSIFPFRGWGGDRPIPTADSQRVPSYGLLEPTGRNPGNLLPGARARPYCPAQAKMPDGFPSGISFGGVSRC